MHSKVVVTACSSHTKDDSFGASFFPIVLLFPQASVQSLTVTTPQSTLWFITKSRTGNTITEPSGAPLGLFGGFPFFFKGVKQVKLVGCCWRTLIRPHMYKHSPTPYCVFPEQTPSATRGTIKSSILQPILACLLRTEGSQQTLSSTKILKKSQVLVEHFTSCISNSFTKFNTG